MTSIDITRHGEARMSQRGIRRSDLETLLVHGTETGSDRFMFRKRDAAKLIQDLKRNLKEEIARVERLVGKEVVVEGGRVITAYHRTKSSKFSKRKAGQRR